MSKCRKCRSMFSEAFYNELSAEQKGWFFSHLESCSKCASEYEGTAVAMQTMSQRERTTPDGLFWQNYWANLENKLVASEKSAFSAKLWWQRFIERLRFQHQLAYRFALGLALVAVGVLIGKFYFGASKTQQFHFRETGLEAELHSQPSLEMRVNRYLDRSKILLLGLVNFDTNLQDTYVLDLPYQKKISRDLVQEANYLKNELSAPGQQQLRKLIADLELILLQIANLEMENDLITIDIVKTGVDQTGILLKINLDKMARRGQLPPGSDVETNKINRSQI
ncbi:MAG TPA: zf-HC2 domain-containing protein [bacterium]|nr:zf-HC2 domain-containing protein [bacterium]